MKKFLLLLAAIAVYTISFAQSKDPDEFKSPSAASQAYENYRGKITRPPYGLEKILALTGRKDVWVRTSKSEDDDDYTSVLLPKIYNSFSFREKFTYHMIQG